ncbi:hypothetical protein PV11_01026 [Exophiala sideris]|uniref:Uncharacterized protein n=1 Tax=Exophiala sideris TaxID=1016849 RepID=A0A0D1ZEW9_9EURO|nr:hypothetical protein PV11_01026 [Exophiala sideris]
MVRQYLRLRERWSKKRNTTETSSVAEQGIGTRTKTQMLTGCFTQAQVIANSGHDDMIVRTLQRAFRETAGQEHSQETRKAD